MKCFNVHLEQKQSLRHLYCCRGPCCQVTHRTTANAKNNPEMQAKCKIHKTWNKTWKQLGNQTKISRFAHLIWKNFYTRTSRWANISMSVTLLILQPQLSRKKTAKCRNNMWSVSTEIPAVNFWPFNVQLSQMWCIHLGQVLALYMQDMHNCFVELLIHCKKTGTLVTTPIVSSFQVMSLS